MSNEPVVLELPERPALSVRTLKFTLGRDQHTGVTDPDTIHVQGYDRSAISMRSAQSLFINVNDVDAFCAALRKACLGPLGRLAVDLEAGDHG
jgi:hypothetical protein